MRDALVRCGRNPSLDHGGACSVICTRHPSKHLELNYNTFHEPLPSADGRVIKPHYVVTDSSKELNIQAPQAGIAGSSDG